MHVARIAKFPPNIVKEAGARVEALQAEGHLVAGTAKGGDEVRAKGESGFDAGIGSRSRGSGLGLG